MAAAGRTRIFVSGLLLLSAAAVEAAPAQRVISLAPHLTELIYTAGGGERLVGVVDYSDWPPAARMLPRVGDSMRLDLERIVQLEPDLVVAWGSGTSPRMLAQVEQLGLRVVALEPHGLQGIADDLRRLGRLLGTAPTAGQAADAFLEQLQALRRRYAGRLEVSVFYQIQDRPLFTVSGEHVISEVIDLCGGRNVFADLARLAPIVSREAVLERDPQAIVAGDFGDGAGLELWREFPQLAATRLANLFAIDANLITRPTTRIVEGAAEMCNSLEAARQRLVVSTRTE